MAQKKKTKLKFKLIGVTRLAKNITIREYYNHPKDTYRYFVANIRGFSGWYFKSQPLTDVMKKVWVIADKIDKKDEKIFYSKKYTKEAVLGKQ